MRNQLHHEEATKTMYLKTLHIQGFRRFDDLSLNFKDGLNVIVGPNNAGKTAVVDALRVLLAASNAQLAFQPFQALFYPGCLGCRTTCISIGFAGIKMPCCQHYRLACQLI